MRLFYSGCILMLHLTLYLLLMTDQMTYKSTLKSPENTQSYRFLYSPVLKGSFNLARVPLLLAVILKFSKCPLGVCRVE